MHWRRKWQPTPVFLPGESQGQGSLVGCHLWGHTESDTTEATQQQQQYCDLLLLKIHYKNFLDSYTCSVDNTLSVYLVLQCARGSAKKALGLLLYCFYNECCEYYYTAGERQGLRD